MSFNSNTPERRSMWSRVRPLLQEVVGHVLFEYIVRPVLEALFHSLF